MHVILLAVGALVTLVGGALMRFGLPLDEYGNSPLLVSGTVALVGGLILIFLALAVRSLNRIAERLDMQLFPLPSKAEIGHAMPAPRATVPPPGAPKPEVKPEPRPELKLDPKPEPVITAPAPEPRAAPAPEPRVEPIGGILPPRPATAKPASKPSLFGWLSGKPRTPEIVGRKGAGAMRPPDAGAPERLDVEPPTRASEPILRASPTPASVPAGNPAPAEPSAGASVYKSGVIDGMTYTLYTDGSIEAELPQGRIRFATVDALQSYLAGR